MRHTTQSPYADIRWSAYVKSLIDRPKPRPSRKEIASALKMDDARIRHWVARKKLPEPDTAFAFGEGLRTAFEWETSGIEALYGLGHWPSLFALLKHLSVDRLGGGQEIALIAYCALPLRFFDFEASALRATIDHIAAKDKATAAKLRRSSKTDIAFFEKAPTMGVLAYYDPQEWSLLFKESIAQLRALDTRRVIARAWGRAYNDEPIFYTAAVADPGTEPVGEDNLNVINAVIELAKKMVGDVPTLAGVRLWRMLAEWAGFLDPIYPGLHELLPDAFSTVGSVEQRMLDMDLYVNRPD